MAYALGPYRTDSSVVDSRLLSPASAHAFSHSQIQSADVWLEEI